MLSKVLAIARFTLLEAVRNRLVWLVLGLVAILWLGGLFVQQVAITETARIRLGFLAATARFATVFVLALHVTSSMVREFNDKGADLLLALDLPRAGYFLGKLAGYLGVAIGMAILVTAAIALVPGSPASGTLAWGASLALELALVAALTLFCVITFAQIMPAMSVVAAFYLVARSIAAIRLMAGSQLIDHSTLSSKVTEALVAALGLALPDLSRFTSTAWLVDGAATLAGLQYVLLQTLVYASLLTLAGLFDLYRKNL